MRADRRQPRVQGSKWEGRERVERFVAGVAHFAQRREQALGRVEFGKERGTHSALSSWASLRVSYIETAGTNRRKMRKQKAKNPSGPKRNDQSKNVVRKTR